MLLIQSFYLLVTTASWTLAAERKASKHSFDYSNEEEYLNRERPLEFNADDGHIFRKDFESKHGYRGERLIAKLGGGAAPLNIYDASLLKPTTTVSPQITTQRNPLTKFLIDVENVETTSAKNEAKEVTPTPIKRKYFSINRNKKNGKSSSKTSRVSRKSRVTTEATPSPADEESLVQKRLYRAVWDHGLRGLPESVSENLRNIDSLFTPSFSNLDLFDQYRVDLAQPQPLSDVAPVHEDINDHLPDNGHLLNAFATAANFQNANNENVNEVREPDFTNGEPSLAEYAGVGEPSLLVASYTYTEINSNPPKFEDFLNNPGSGSQVVSDNNGQDNRNQNVNLDEISLTSDSPADGNASPFNPIEN